MQHHNSIENVIQSCLFDDVMSALGEDAYLAYLRERGDEEIDWQYDLLDRTRCYAATRKTKLDVMKKEVDDLYQKYPLDELLALKEFVYYENDKNGEIYRLQQGIKFLEDAAKCASGIELEKYYLGIAHRHYAVTYELKSDLLQDTKVRERCIEQWKGYSLLSNEELKGDNENTVRGYASMNIEAWHGRIYINANYCLKKSRLCT